MHSTCKLVIFCLTVLLFLCSLCTTLCLQWEPQAIAVAFLYLAGKLTKFDLQGLSQSKSRSWWRQFVDTLDFHDLECKKLATKRKVFDFLSLSLSLSLCSNLPSSVRHLWRERLG